jgi:hypothetical protein
MHRLMIALTVASVAGISSAQTTTAVDGKQRVAPAAEKAKSKDVPKTTTAEKDKMAKDVNKSMVNPDNPVPRGTGDFPPYGPRKTRPFIGGGPEISGK